MLNTVHFFWVCVKGGGVNVSGFITLSPTVLVIALPWGQDKLQTS